MQKHLIINKFMSNAGIKLYLVNFLTYKNEIIDLYLLNCIK